MGDIRLAASKILIIDDQPSNVLLLEGILQEEDYTAYRSITDSRQSLTAFLEYRPDLVLVSAGFDAGVSDEALSVPQAPGEDEGGLATRGAGVAAGAGR